MTQLRDLCLQRLHLLCKLVSVHESLPDIIKGSSELREHGINLLLLSVHNSISLCCGRAFAPSLLLNYTFNSRRWNPPRRGGGASSSSPSSGFFLPLLRDLALDTNSSSSLILLRSIFFFPFVLLFLAATLASASFVISGSLSISSCANRVITAGL